MEAGPKCQALCSFEQEDTSGTQRFSEVDVSGGGTSGAPGVCCCYSGRGGGRPQEDDQSDLVTPRVWGGKEEGTPAQAWKPTVSREKGQNS